MTRKRSVILSFVFAIASLITLTARKVFEYSAAPDGPKQSDFVFPNNPEQEKPILLVKAPDTRPLPFRQSGGFTNDASHLNRTAIYGIVQPANEEEIRNALRFARENNLKVTPAGEQHSMGGQSFTHGGLVLDLRNLNQIRLDKEHKRVTVQSGVRWWQLQRCLDQNGLSVKSMQSINLFSVGGTLSVNAHGIDPAPGPIAPTVHSIRVMLADGNIVVATPSHNPELFRHVLGGYGLFGIILDAELDIVDNEMYVREALYMDYKEYPRFYRSHVEGASNVGLVFGRLSVAPQSFLRETAVHLYTKTKFDASLPPLQPARHNALGRFVINFSKTGALGRWFRWTLEKYAEPRLHTCVTRNQAMNDPGECLVSRNEEMYDDMAYLQNRLRDTDILQEYFVPYDRMPEFVDRLRSAIASNRANLLNATIRTVHKDTVTALPYAKQDMLAFVLYFNVKFNDRDNEILRKTTVDLIDAAESLQGTFYLPYQLHYSKDQLRDAYPEIDDFFSVKRRYDPNELFTNKFYEKYAETDRNRVAEASFQATAPGRNFAELH